MAKRQKIVAGNWKMNKTFQEAQTLANEIKSKDLAKDVTVILATPSVFCESVGRIISDSANIKIGAQNCYQEERGAFTGEISAEMLQSIGVQYVIVGHSERREYFKENSEVLVKKVDLLLSKNMTPIYCCGEPLDIRNKGKHVSHVAKQIKKEICHLDSDNIQKVVIAYEPIWAIGTGLTASPEQAQEMHAEIRKTLKSKFGKRVADKISILYGGSMNAANAKTLLAQSDVDGGLIGGASLKADDFATIINGYPA